MKGTSQLQLLWRLQVSAEPSKANTDAADMYSCGVLLHHMLTGGLPSRPRIHPGGRNATLDPAVSQVIIKPFHLLGASRAFPQV